MHISASKHISSAGIKTRAEGHDGTRGEGRGRPRVAATDDQEQGREEGGTREGNTDGTDTDRSIMVELLKYYPDCTIHLS